MPMIEMYVPADSLDASTRASLPDELATILLKWEGAPDTEFFRSVTWVYVHDAAPLIGGRGSGEPRFRVDITVPEGALSPRRKAGLIEDVHAAVVRAAGLSEEQALHVWTLIRDVPEGAWGAAGQPVSYAQLREIATAQRAEEQEAVG